MPLYLLCLIIPIPHYKTTIQIFSATQMKFAVSFLVFLLTLLLVLTLSPLSCSTTQHLVFYFFSFLYFQFLPLNRYFPSDWKSFIPFRLSPNLSTPPPHGQVRSWNVTSLTICTSFVLLITSFLIVSLVSNWDSQLKQLYYLLSILGFLHWISKCSLCGFFDLTEAFNSVPHKTLIDSLPSLDLPRLGSIYDYSTSNHKWFSIF